MAKTDKKQRDDKNLYTMLGHEEVPGHCEVLLFATITLKLLTAHLETFGSCLISFVECIRSELSAL